MEKPEVTLDKMSKADPMDVSDEVTDTNFNTIKSITKNFIDDTNENFSKCSQYAPFLAWTS